jgi:hypothetical protein
MLPSFKLSCQWSVRKGVEGEDSKGLAVARYAASANNTLTRGALIPAMKTAANELDEIPNFDLGAMSSHTSHLVISHASDCMTSHSQCELENLDWRIGRAAATTNFGKASGPEP